MRVPLEGLVALFALLIFGCNGADDSNTATPTATATPTTTATPSPTPTALPSRGFLTAIGPVALFAILDGPHEVVLFDAGGEEEVGRFPVQGDPVGIAGLEVVIRTDNRVAVLDLDGREVRTLFEASGRMHHDTPTSVRLSPDASVLFVIEHDNPECAGACLHFIEVETGDVIRTMQQSATRLDAGPHVHGWRSDGGAVALSQNHNGPVIPGFSGVTVDGEEVWHFDDWGLASPDHRYFAAYRDRLDVPVRAVDLFFGSIELVEASSGEVVTEVRPEGQPRAGIHYGEVEWSPDGESLLVAVRTGLPLPGDEPQEMGDTLDETVTTWFQLDVVAGQQQAVSDPATVRSTWYAGRFAFECAGPTSETPSSAVGRVTSPPCVASDGRSADVALLIDGRQVATAQRIVVLGLIDTP